MDKENVQGLILDHYRYRQSRHLLFHLPAAAVGRDFIQAILPFVSHGAMDLTQKPDWLCNLGITYQGLLQLGCPEALCTTLDPQFQEGPAPQAMGDQPGSPSAGSKWWDGQWTTDQIHLTVQIYARDPQNIATATQQVLGFATAAGLEELLPRQAADLNGSRRLDGAALPRTAEDTSPGAKLHFGYRDGFSQPEVDWDAVGNGALDRAHFLLGYSNAQVPSAPSAPAAADFFRDGSYMVVRWLQQDVASFESYLTAAAAALPQPPPNGDGREFVAAKMMGRWRDGTPLVLSPDHPDPSLAGQNFDYQISDPLGARCPFSAHIRVVFPRDQPLSNAEIPTAPRLIRRGMPYGPEWPDGQVADDGIDRGIIGVFFCTSLARQFYTVMHWISHNNFSPVFTADHIHDQDLLFGNRRIERASQTWRISDAGGTMPRLPDFVRTRGTAFFLLPSLNTLQALST